MMSFDPQTLAEHSRRLKQHAEKIQRDQRRNARLDARPRRPVVSRWMFIVYICALAPAAALGLLGFMFAFGFLFGLFLQ